jgi:hypothetical protein
MSKPANRSDAKNRQSAADFQMKVTRPPEAPKRESAKTVDKPIQAPSIEDVLRERAGQHATPEISPGRPKDGPVVALIIFLIGVVPYVVAAIAGIVVFLACVFLATVYFPSYAHAQGTQAAGGLGLICFMPAAAVFWIVLSLFQTK